MRIHSIALLLALAGCASPPEEDPRPPEPAVAEPMAPTMEVDPATTEPTDTAGFIPPQRDSVRQGPIIELPAAPDGPPGSRTDQ